jgi:hypothetical protein
VIDGAATNLGDIVLPIIGKLFGNTQVPIAQRYARLLVDPHRARLEHLDDVLVAKPRFFGPKQSQAKPTLHLDHTPFHNRLPPTQSSPNP